MKISKLFVMVLLCMLALNINVYATDFSTVNQKSVDAFMKMFPEYRAKLEEIGVSAQNGNEMLMAHKYKNELDGIFQRYGITYQEFPAFMQKLTMGYSMIQMENSGIDINAMGMGQFNNLTPEEKTVIEKNYPRIQKMLEADE